MIDIGLLIVNDKVQTRKNSNSKNVNKYKPFVKYENQNITVNEL